MTLPPGPFDVCVADPPWRFASNSDAKPNRNARRHYPCMRTTEIMALPVPNILARDSLLLLWATAPMLLDALQVMDAWGHRYVSQVVWVKDRIATGYWARGRHELLLIGRRGKPYCPRPLFGDSVIEAKRREHSRKPGHVHAAVDKHYPESAKIELFARRPREGWTCWGNQLAAA